MAERISRKLSIVIPAFNEEGRIGPSLGKILDFGRSALDGFEILVADDGSSDGTREIVRELARGEPALKLVELPENRGKGAAVRQGMLAATLPYVLFTDADLSTPIEDVERLFEAIDRVPVAIGSRAVTGSRIEVHQPFYRELMGRSFNLMVQAAAVPGIHDSQCGFKLFRTETAKRLFSSARLDGFAFDVEVLFLCRKLGIEIA
jgi:dolichyl-phosphate beta-glucosyltransferase